MPCPYARPRLNGTFYLVAGEDFTANRGAWAQRPRLTASEPLLYPYAPRLYNQ